MSAGRYSSHSESEWAGAGQVGTGRARSGAQRTKTGSWGSCSTIRTLSASAATWAARSNSPPAAPQHGCGQHACVGTSTVSGSLTSARAVPNYAKGAQRYFQGPAEACTTQVLRYRHSVSVGGLCLGEVGYRQDDALPSVAVAHTEVKPHAISMVARIRSDGQVVLPLPDLCRAKASPPLQRTRAAGANESEVPARWRVHIPRFLDCRSRSWRRKSTAPSSRRAHLSSCLAFLRKGLPSAVASAHVGFRNRA
jgi:hypothetical protein